MYMCIHSIFYYIPVPYYYCVAWCCLLALALGTCSCTIPVCTCTCTCSYVYSTCRYMRLFFILSVTLHCVSIMIACGWCMFKWIFIECLYVYIYCMNFGWFFCFFIDWWLTNCCFYCYLIVSLFLFVFLFSVGMETTGIFRRTAAKARVELLKELIENSPGRREGERGRGKEEKREGEREKGGSRMIGTLCIQDPYVCVQ